MTTKYRVMTVTLCGAEDAWTVYTDEHPDGTPERFDTEAEALAEIRAHVEEMNWHYEQEDIEDFEEVDGYYVEAVEEGR